MSETKSRTADIPSPPVGSTAERVRALASPVVEQEGYELIDVEFVTERGRAILRMYVDTVPPGDEHRGITVDDCSHISRIVSDLLDVEDDDEAAPRAALIGGNYNLEVSSPGLFRPLTKAAHFERVVGERIKVKTYQKIEERRVFTGVLVEFNGANGAQNGTLVVDVDGRQYSLPLADVAKANLEPELNF